MSSIFSSDLRLRLLDVSKQLDAASKTFRSEGLIAGKREFSTISGKEDFSVFEHAIYFNLWRARNEPSGDSKYGEHCFHDTHKLSSSAREKADAIDKLRMQILTYLKTPCLLSNLRQISASFRSQDFEWGMQHFSFTLQEERVFEHDIYYNLWKILGKPKGNAEYGRDCFHQLEKLPKTARQRADAIDMLFQDYAVLTYIENRSVDPQPVDSSTALSSRVTPPSSDATVPSSIPLNRRDVSRFFNSPNPRAPLTSQRTNDDLADACGRLFLMFVFLCVPIFWPLIPFLNDRRRT